MLNIVFPVLNEEDSLEKGIAETISFLNSNNIPYSITIADNGSTDKTQSIAQEISAKNKNIYYLKLKRKGVGLAFRESIKYNTQHLKCPYIGYMDIDLATDLKHLKEVYSLLKKGDKIVVGSRLLKNSKVSGRSIKREITSRALNLILKILLGVKFSDAMCGFKFYDTKTAEFLVNNCGIDDSWFYCAQMLIVAEAKGLKISEIPVVWQDDPNSKVKILSLSQIYLKEIFKLLYKKIKRAI
ncbi:glycosyltransferase [Helicobacter canadensis]|uniref:Glycosyltransferase 2-like domain-containing protein n=1 Tax=Helicobacter canadensis MIT 98-5491 TaxID=537970 RepID=C5ZXN6_9HELI|nr:glycosyltransferase [Helicobacter canadensis]EES89904.1 conserved hypothetical protein [Helicobacter canadensis MIT 98-5491]EFR49050.1 glycosyltransferase, group 2 family protein [Helicobacter canadensis MIT 98-5491]STP02596.1 putative glycosyltransferase [Helicobacter canadensis]